MMLPHQLSLELSGHRMLAGVTLHASPTFIRCGACRRGLHERSRDARARRSRAAERARHV